MMQNALRSTTLPAEISLDAYLSAWASGDDRKTAVARAIEAIAAAGVDIAARIARGPLGQSLGAVVGENKDGDAQKALDIWANDRLIEALGGAGVAALASEELDAPIALNEGGPVIVALDPLDGSSNIDTNVSIGTIFSVLPTLTDGVSDFLQPGSAQCAAGYIIYGPHTGLLLTIGDGTQSFVLDPVDRRFKLAEADVRTPVRTAEYAINASNYRHWSAQIRAYIDDCIAGIDGPREADVNMRWIASLVAEAQRILVRGGVFLYPRDMRDGYENGRIRLVYEANPVAFLIEQAGGKAFDGRTRIMDLVPTAIHQRVPFMFGSAEEIDRIARYKSDASIVVARAPLFHRRGLFKL